MLQVTRLGNNWVAAENPNKANELVLVHLDSLRQEAVDPIHPSAVIATFSFLTIKHQAGTEIPVPTEADLKSASKWQDEVVLLMDLNDGANAVRLFDTVAQVLLKVVMGDHPAMTYAEYIGWLKTEPRYGRTYYAEPNPASPTGRFAVWQVMFSRTFGLGEDGLFAKQSAVVSYRFGYMGEQEVFPGTIYNFPARFVLTREFEGDSFLNILASLLEVASKSSDAALVEPYWIK